MDTIQFDLITTEAQHEIYNILTTSVENGGVVSHSFATHFKTTFSNAEEIILSYLGDYISCEMSTENFLQELKNVHSPFESSEAQSEAFAKSVMNALMSMLDRLDIGSTGRFQSVEVILTIEGRHQINKNVLVECPVTGLTREHLEQFLVDRFDAVDLVSFQNGKDGAIWTISNNCVEASVLSEVIEPSHPIYSAYQQISPNSIYTS